LACWRLVTETDWYLPVHQAGFRQHRGTRDNIFILAQIMDAVMARGEEMITVFIDYVAAFDSVSHKFIDDALRKAKASNKCRAMFRALYDSASAVVRVRKNDGTDVFSEPFPIDRGVVQGAIDSPCAVCQKRTRGRTRWYTEGGVEISGQGFRQFVPAYMYVAVLEFGNVF
jgi:hypothetical protein